MKDCVLEHIEFLLNLEQKQKQEKWEFVYNDFIYIITELNKLAPYFAKLNVNLDDLRVAEGRYTSTNAKIVFINYQQKGNFILKIDNSVRNPKRFDLEMLEDLGVELFKEICEDYRLYISSFFKDDLKEVTKRINNFTTKTWCLKSSEDVVEFYAKLLTDKIEELEKKVGYKED